MVDYDLIVIGAGATGLEAARGARRDGRRVALVEAEKPGGDCTHYGCVPSKTLIETARRVHAARSGSDYGFSAEPVVDFPAVMRRVHAVIAEIEQDESPELLARQGIDLVSGWATLTGPTQVEVAGRSLSAEKIVVACGSRALVPPIDGLDEVDHLDNRSIFDLTELPEHLLVLGGGAIGCELAQAFRRLGARVSIIEGAPTLVGKEEPEAQEVLQCVFEREGIELHLGAKVVRASAGPTLHLEDGSTVSGSHLLVAVGRQPATDGLGLEAAGVRLENGRIVTDEHLRAAETVWAAGDCTSTLQFTHVGDEQGRLAARNAFAGPLPWQSGSWDGTGIPWVTFTEPEIGHVGMTEAQAVAEHGEKVMVSMFLNAAGDRARAAGETDGFVKLVAVPGTVGGLLLGKLVGMTAVGPMAGELIAEGALSMRAGTLLARMAQTVHAYPTWSLSTRIAAAQFFDRGPNPARPGRA